MASSWLGDATSLLARCLVTFGVVVDAMVRLTCAGWLPLDGLFGRGVAAGLRTNLVGFTVESRVTPITRCHGASWVWMGVT